jgi:hypothetical protein
LEQIREEVLTGSSPAGWPRPFSGEMAEPPRQLEEDGKFADELKADGAWGAISPVKGELPPQCCYVAAGFSGDFLSACP